MIQKLHSLYRLRTVFTFFIILFFFFSLFFSLNSSPFQKIISSHELDFLAAEQESLSAKDGSQADNKLESAQIQSLLNLGTDPAHIYWPFEDSSWEQPNGWRITYGNTTDHINSDAQAQDWIWGAGLNDDCGKTIKSAIAGTVIFSGHGSHTGNHVIVQSNENPEFAFLAGHLADNSMPANGTPIAAGDTLGKLARGGNAATDNCHLHTALYKNIISKTCDGASVMTRLTSGASACWSSTSEHAASFVFDVNLPANIVGTIKDSAGNPVNRAYITFVGGGVTKAMISGSDGKYTIPDVPTGSATIYATNEPNTQYGEANVTIYPGINEVNINFSGACINGVAAAQSSFISTEASFESFDPCGEDPPPTGACTGYGWFCGVGGDTNTLYYCSSQGADPQVSQVCPNECKVNPPGTPDVCIASPTEKVKFFGDSNYGSLRLELGPGLFNDPTSSTPYKSIQLPSGWSMLMYSLDNQNGDTKCISASDPIFENTGWATRVESVFISASNICPQSLEDGVYLYTGVSYTGTQHKFNADAPSVEAAGFPNDSAQSIRIVGDWSAELFVDGNYGGSNYTFDGGVENLNNYPIGKQTSSIMIRKRVPSRFTLYAGGDYSSDSFASDRSISDLNKWGFANRPQSVKVDAGYEIILCTHPNFHGICGRTSTSIGYVNTAANGLAGHVNSIQTCVGTCPPAPTVPNMITPSDGTRFDPGTSVDFNWSATGKESFVEIWGGDLANSIESGWMTTNSWTKTGLAASSNVYYWHVKGGNDFGESAWSETRSFFVRDITPENIYLYGTFFGVIDTTYTYDAYVNPSNASNLVYAWSPVPLSGQGTSTATYQWADTGTKNISLTVTNSGGQTVATRTIQISCKVNQFEMSSFSNSTLTGTPMMKSCVDNVNFDPGQSGVVIPDFGTGADGALVISTNTTIAPLETLTNADQGSIYASYNTAVAFAIGQKVLLYQSTGTNAGQYEIRNVLDLVDGYLKFDKPLNNNYRTNSSELARIVVIKQYTDVTINQGATLTVTPWNDYHGGLFVFFATGKVDIKGTIDVSGKGYLGAPSDGGGGPGVVKQGKSYLDNSQDYSWDPNQGGGGGGERHPAGGDGGGGAGYAQTGSNGARYQGHYGLGGEAYGAADLSRIFLGSGGGGGGADQDSPSGFGGGFGGNGGGIIMWYAKEADISGNIFANGAGGQNLPTNGDHGGGGGGGSGGSIRGFFINGNIGTNQVTATGGAGGTGTGTGGNGSAGRIYLEYCGSVTGQTNPTANAVHLNCMSDNFSQSYIGSYQFEAKNYTFTLQSEGGTRLYIDGTMAIDKWTDGTKTNTYKILLSQGLHDIKVEYFKTSGNAKVILSWDGSVDEPPVVTDIPAQTVAEDTNFTNIDLDNYGSDPDIGDAITWSYAGSNNVVIDIDYNNIATLQPKKDWFGTETITFRATDLAGLFAERQATFTVTPVNDAPTITSSPVILATPDKLYTYQVIAADGVNENQVLTYRLITAPTGMLINSAGLINWTPKSTDVGNKDVKIEVSDGLLSGTQAYTINVSYVSSDFVNSIDDHEVLLSNWQEDATAGFNSTNDNGYLNVQTSLNKNAKKTFTYNKWVNLEIGKTYYLAANMKTQSADQAKVSVNLYDANFKLLGTPKTIAGPSGTKEWSEYRTSYLIPSTYNSKKVKYAKVVLTSGDINGAGVTQAITYFDAIYFTTNGRPYAGITYTPAVVKEGDTVTLSGTTSKDPDKNLNLQYSWTQVDGPAVTIANNTLPTASFVVPTNIDKNFVIKIKLVVSDGIVSSVPLTKSIDVNGYIDGLVEEFIDKNNWENITTADFITSLDNGNLLIKANTATKTSKVTTSPFIKVSNATYKLAYRVKSEDAGKLTVTVTGYNASFKSPTIKTCTATGLTGTKDYMYFNCDISMFKSTPSLKYAKVTFNFTSVSDQSKLWIDYVQLKNATTDVAPVIVPIPSQTINQGQNFTTIDLKSFATDADVNDKLIWSYKGNTQIKVSIDSNNITTLTYPFVWNGSETITFTVTDLANKGVSIAPVFKVNAATSWINASNTLSAARSGSLTVLKDGRVLLIDGRSNTINKTAEIYDPNANTWTRTADMTTARMSHTATLLKDGRVLVVGGYGPAISAAEIYNPTTNIWTSAGNLTSARYNHTASLLPSGKVLIVGGYNGSSYSLPVEIYDPSTNKWTTGPKQAFDRAEHTATTIAGGKVLIVGGYNGNVLNSVEIYDPATNKWTTKSNMANLRTRQTATLLSSGKVLVAGGWNGDMLNSAEIYNPNTNTWTATTTMSNKHADHTAELFNGKVYVIGGSQMNNSATNTVEIYDPVAGTWANGPIMNSVRRWHRSAAFGKTILVVGGENGSGTVLDKSEILSY